MTENERLDRLADTIGGFVFPIGLLVMIGGPAIWTWQCFHWLKTGEWTALPIVAGFAYAGIDPPQFSWIGAQKISDWIMAAPLSVGLIAIALALLTAFTTWADGVGRKAREDRLTRERDELSRNRA